MQRLEVSCAVRPIYGSLGAKGLMTQYIKQQLQVVAEVGSKKKCDFSLN
jgi:hypothetical protein